MAQRETGPKDITDGWDMGTAGGRVAASRASSESSGRAGIGNGRDPEARLSVLEGRLGRAAQHAAQQDQKIRQLQEMVWGLIREKRKGQAERPRSSIVDAWLATYPMGGPWDGESEAEEGADAEIGPAAGSPGESHSGRQGLLVDARDEP